jgi:hypothetical protein
MANTRFLTARDLYEAFPIAADDVGVEANDEGAIAFLQELIEKKNWDAAISYCAYLLPRREAVWWACQSLRRIQPHRGPQDTRAIELAEAWVREPEEDRRLSALSFGTEGDHRAPATWMALAAGWSGGNVMPDHGYAHAMPEQTARAIRAGLLGAMAWVPTDTMASVLKPCLEEGIELAQKPAHGD